MQTPQRRRSTEYQLALPLELPQALSQQERRSARQPQRGRDAPSPPAAASGGDADSSSGSPRTPASGGTTTGSGVGWDGRLDERTRQIGRQGIAAARARLAPTGDPGPRGPGQGAEQAA